MDPVTEVYCPYSEIVDHLEIQKGDIVYIASNLIKLMRLAQKKEKEFSADKFIESFQKKVGPEGTLLFPAYNYTLKSGQNFDIKKTQPITGALAVAAFRRPDFKRTKHPLHSFAVWGKYTEQLINMNNISSFASDSPFHFLYEKRAKLLSIDLDLQHSLTFVHYVEELEKVNYRYWKSFAFEYVDDYGESSIKKYKLFAKRFGYINDVNALGSDFINKKALEEKTINGIDFKLIHLDQTVEIIRDDIRNNGAKKIKRFKMSVFFKDFFKMVIKK
jgi:aminoglycoside 3-N-acetyltransferase